MKKIFTLIALTHIVFNAFTQSFTDTNFCGFNSLIELKKQNIPGYTQQLDSLEKRYQAWLSQNPVQRAVVTIPVVVHVIHNNQSYGSGSNISYNQIKWQIAALNTAFANNYPNYNLQQTGSYAVNTKIQFCLAKQLAGPSSWNTNPSGEIEFGVTRHSTSNPNALINDPSNFSCDSALINLTHPNSSYFPFKQYLNIWVVEGIIGGIAAYSDLPGFNTNSPYRDGITIIYDRLGDNSVNGNGFALNNVQNRGKVLTHEVGHYLGLYHLFDEGFTPSPCQGYDDIGSIPAFSDCSQYGDFICDSPPQKKYFYGSQFNNPLINYPFVKPNTCFDQLNAFNNIDEPDMIENFMAYSSDAFTNTFTNGQRNRMDFVLNDTVLNRSYLINPLNSAQQTLVSNNGISCSCNHVVSNIVYSPAAPCSGTTVTLQTPISPLTNNHTYNWSISPANYTIVNGTLNTAQLQVIFNTNTNYTISLTVTDVNNQTSTTNTTINVNSPTAKISNYYPGATVCNGTEDYLLLSFTGTPPFTAQISNGSTTFSINTNENSYYHPIIHNKNNPAYTLVNASANACNASVSGNATFNIIDCCPVNNIVNSDFNAATGCSNASIISPFISDLTPGCNIKLQTSDYAVYDVANSNIGNWPRLAGLHNKGNSFYFNGEYFTQTSPINHVVLLEQNMNLVPGTSYLVEFYTTSTFFTDPNTPNYQYPIPTTNENLSVKINGVFNTPVFTLQYPSNFNKVFWIKHSFLFTPTTAANNIALCDIGSNPSNKNYLIDDFTIREISPVVIASASNDSVCFGASLNLTATGGTSYSWVPSAGLSCDTCTITTINSLTATTTYTVYSTTAAGCITFDTITVTAVPSSCIGALTINQPTTYNTANPFAGFSTIAINADVRLGGSQTYTITNASVSVFKNRKITVTQNSTLIIDASYLYACNAGNVCDGMWDGIYIEPGSKLIIRNFTVVEDALNAVVANSSVASRPLIEIKETIFNKNKIGVKTETYTGSDPISGWQFINSIFTCRNISANLIQSILGNAAAFNTFKNNLYNTAVIFPSTLTLEGVRSYAGIAAYNSSIDIGSAISSVLINIFDNLDYGIYLSNDQTGPLYTIKNNRFQNLAGQMIADYPYGVGIFAQSYVNGTPAGLLTIGSAGANNGNNFYNTFRGVHTEGLEEVRINYNYFDNRGYLSGPAPNYYTIGGHAIYSQEVNTTFQADNNSIFNCDVGIQYLRNYIRNIIPNTQEPMLSINSNNIHVNRKLGSMSFGILVMDILNNTLTTNRSMTVNFNTISRAKVEGIRISNIKNGIEVKENNVRMEYATAGNIYGINSEFSDNIIIVGNVVRSNYTGTYYNGTANWDIRGVLVNTSPDFTVRCNDVGLVGRCFEFQGNCFSPQLSNSTNTLASNGFESNAMSNSRSGLFIGANGAFIGQQGSLQNPMANKWVNKNSLNYWDKGNTYVDAGSNSANSILYCLNSFPASWPTNHQGTGSVFTNPPIPNWTIFSSQGGTEYQCPAQNPSPQLAQYNFAYLLNRLISDSIGNSSTKDQLRFSKYLYVLNSIKKNSSLQSDPFLNSFYATYINAAPSMFNSADSLITLQKNTEAISLNNSIVVNNIVELNKQKVNDIVLRTKSGKPDLVDISALEQIANQCALTGGNAVIQARNLLMQIRKEVIYFNENCPSELEKVKDKNSDKGAEKEWVNVYPNPNNGSMTFEYKLQQDAELTITDIAGKILCSYKLPADVTSVQINCDVLENGIYLYKVLQNNLEIKSNIVVIIK